MRVQCAELKTDSAGSAAFHHRTDDSTSAFKRHPRTESWGNQRRWGHSGKQSAKNEPETEKEKKKKNRFFKEKENEIKWSLRHQNNDFHETGFLYQKQQEVK